MTEERAPVPPSFSQKRPFEGGGENRTDSSKSTLTHTISHSRGFGPGIFFNSFGGSAMILTHSIAFVGAVLVTIGAMDWSWPPRWTAGLLVAGWIIEAWLVWAVPK